MDEFGDLLHLSHEEGADLRSNRVPSEEGGRLAQAYRALGDPTRVALALTLDGGRELCVCDLAWVTERPQNLISHHMQVLRRGGVVHSRKDGKMTMYRLTDHGTALLRALRPEAHRAAAR